MTGSFSEKDFLSGRKLIWKSYARSSAMHSTRLDFEKLNNVRDIGGIKTKSGAVIKSGRLYRSGHLYDASQSDWDKLSDMLELVIDFRSDMEKQEKPDPEISGIRYLHIPIIDELTAGITREESADKSLMKLIYDPEAALKYMIATYEGFVTSKMSVNMYKRFIELISEDRGKGVLWHCTAGKDRAGVGTVLVLKILGVADEDIMEDYLYTNECLTKDVESLSNMIEERIGSTSPEIKEATKILFGARQEYLEGLYSRVTELYGDFDSYMYDGLGIDDVMKEKFNELYLE